jgi:hypothetical protein
VALDIRIPIGLLFAVLGSILLGYGVLNHVPKDYSLGHVDVNIGWGSVLIIFGVSMLLLARRHSARVRTRTGEPR